MMEVCEPEMEVCEPEMEVCEAHIGLGMVDWVARAGRSLARVYPRRLHRSSHA
jgi:hypothetical protein